MDANAVLLATALALIMVGFLMFEGISIGCISYVVINLLCGKRDKLTPLMYILAALFVCKYIFL